MREAIAASVLDPEPTPQQAGRDVWDEIEKALSGIVTADVLNLDLVDSKVTKENGKTELVDGKVQTDDLDRSQTDKPKVSTFDLDLDRHLGQGEKGMTDKVMEDLVSPGELNLGSEGDPPWMFCAGDALDVDLDPKWSRSGTMDVTSSCDG